MKGNSMKKEFLWMVLTTLAAEAAIAIPIAFAFAVTSIWQETGKPTMDLSLILEYYQGHPTVDTLGVVGLCIGFVFGVVAPRTSD